MLRSSILFLTCATAAVSGCVGGGGEEDEGAALARMFTQSVSTNGAYGELGVAAAAQLEQLQNQRVTSGANLPPSGSATYSGHLGLGEPENGVLGKLALTATFGGTGALDGSVRDFVNASGQSVDGELTIANGSIRPFVDPDEQWQVNASISGTVDRPNGSSTVDGILQADFVGDQGQGISGEVKEFVTIDNTSTSTATGYFGATRD